MASFPDELNGAPPAGASPFVDDGFDGSASDRFGSYSEFTQETTDDAEIYDHHHQNAPFQEDDVFHAPESNGGPVNGVFVDSDSPILPPPSEMREEGFALREWRRENAARLEEKEKIEKESLGQILKEASEYKVAFYEKRKVTCENNITTNREKEKLFVASHEKFHKEANQKYWKTIAELVPNEVPSLQKKGKKEQDKKPAITVVQGPKPGKPTDLSRMRQILLKLKHDTPPHLKLSPSAETDKGSSSINTANAPPQAIAVAATPEAVLAT